MQAGSGGWRIHQILSIPNTEEPCCGMKKSGIIFTLFSFLETLRRAGEGVAREAESGRFLLALSDL